MNKEKHIGYEKILFRFYSNALEEETIETMWAKVIDLEKGLYQLDSIPFYGHSVSSDDIVFAMYMEILLTVDYRTIKSELDKFTEAETLEYAEPSLSEKHRQDITLR